MNNNGMENKGSQSSPEKAPSQTFTVSFTDTKFEGNNEHTGGTDGLVDKIIDWLEKAVAENKIPIKTEVFDRVKHHILELAKNALEARENGVVSVSFEKDGITVVVSNTGQGWGNNPSEDMLYGSPDHGLDRTMRYADEFSIETDQKKYTKISGQVELEETENPSFVDGTKITFKKSY